MSIFWTFRASRRKSAAAKAIQLCSRPQKDGRPFSLLLGQFAQPLRLSFFLHLLPRRGNAFHRRVGSISSFAQSSFLIFGTTSPFCAPF